MFRALGMELVADDDPGSVEDLAPYADGGRALVAVGADDKPVGYLLIDVVDAAAHIEQVSVHPHQARRGIGSELIDEAASWARAQGLRALTLTTYTDVPWNGPYYERLGFRYLARTKRRRGCMRSGITSGRRDWMPGRVPACAAMSSSTTPTT